MVEFTIINFSEFKEDMRPYCGNKASNLAILYQAGFNVPNGFIVPISALHETTIFSSANDDLISTFSLLRSPIAVRSSAVNEDSKDRSFAGIFLSILNIISADGYIEALNKVYASSKLGFINNYAEAVEQGMAIIVQEFIKAEHSGIVFTINPVNGDTSEMVVEYFNGLGPAIVGGKTTPQHLVMIKTDNKIREYILRDNGIACYANEGGGYREINISGHEVTHINELILCKLADEAKKIEDIFGCPQDIEWAVVEGKVFILQSRPITTLLLAEVI